MCGTLRVRGEVPAQVNKAVDVETGRVKELPLAITIADGTNFILFIFRKRGIRPALTAFSRSRFSDCVC